MLDVVGASDIDALYRDVPAEALRKELPALPRVQSEMAVERTLSALAAKNRTAGQGRFFIGAGAYKHHVPASVDHLIQRSEFLTTYTPYQPEIAQGTLQALYEFQTQVAMLTGMEVANASMYDGSTACAEAAAMAARVTKRDKIVMSGGLHPHYASTTRTLCEALGFEVVQAPAAIDDEAGTLAFLDERTAGVIVQSPNVFGTLTDLRPIASAAQDKGALLIAAFTEVVAFGLIEPAGAMGADIVVGEGQSIGNALNFGGPYVGLFAANQKHLRQMPGRLAGATVDAEGTPGFVLTLSTREQHIRREKATSNICTNSGLCSLAFTIHMSLLGAKGLRQLAQLNHERATQLADALGKIAGVEIATPRFFNEFAVRTRLPGATLVERLAERDILGGVAFSRLAPAAGLEDLMLVCATEMTTDEDIAAYADALAEAL